MPEKVRLVVEFDVTGTADPMAVTQFAALSVLQGEVHLRDARCFVNDEDETAMYEEAIEVFSDDF